MSAPNWLRALPVLATIELLTLAAIAPRPAAVGVAPPSQAYPPCDAFAYAGGGDSVLAIVPNAGVAQPLPAGISMAACSLRVTSSTFNAAASVLVRQWDPTTLAPDAHTVALRAQWLDPSSFVYAGGAARRVQFVPPVVTRSVSGVADPPRLTTAFEFISRPYSPGPTPLAWFDPDGDPNMPAAGELHADGTRAPLQGSHPVIAHAICAGDEDLNQLRVAQSVMRTDALPAIGTDGYAQRFRVPQPVELRWIELALNTSNYPNYPTGRDTVSGPRMPLRYATVGVIDGAEMAAPSAIMPPALVEAFVDFYVATDRPVWVSCVDLDRTITLQPGRDYWLYVRDAALGTLRFQLAQRTANESADFNAGIGPYFERDTSLAGWHEPDGRALSFRLIGRPVPVLPGPPTPQRGDLRLRVAPNPAQENILAGWSGAVGPVRLELYDARGRKVAAGAGGAAGSWQFSRTGLNGQALPAGVYFVHARDTAGGHVIQRVVLLR